MAKKWDVKIDGQMYNLQMNGKKMTVNGEKLKLAKFRKKMGFVHEEYEIPVGSKTALLVIRNLSAPQLVIDGRDCATGEEYVPFKMPWWVYLFIVLHCVNFINGAVGGAMAVIGIAVSTSIAANRKMNVVLRILLNVAILVLVYGVVFGVAFGLASITGRI